MLVGITFPLYGIHDGKCRCGFDCKSPGKHPRIASWRDLTEDVPTEPGDNIGLKLVDAFVIDIDGPEGEAVWKGILDSRKANEPETRVVTTGREGGGRHLYFWQPKHRKFGCGKPWGPGIDLKGIGGYVVAEGSLHVSGRVYKSNGRDIVGL